jgi:hypothetical protein
MPRAAKLGSSETNEQRGRAVAEGAPTGRECDSYRKGERSPGGGDQVVEHVDVALLRRTRASWKPSRADLRRAQRAARNGNRESRTRAPASLSPQVATATRGEGEASGFPVNPPSRAHRKPGGSRENSSEASSSGRRAKTGKKLPRFAEVANKQAVVFLGVAIDHAWHTPCGSRVHGAPL